MNDEELEDALIKIKLLETKENDELEKALLEIATNDSILTERLTIRKFIVDGYIIVSFSDGTYASNTSMMEKRPFSVLDVTNFGGNCAFVALYMENRHIFYEHFGIVSPYGLMMHLKKLKSGIHFEKRTMMEADDFIKIATALNVSFTVKFTNAGRAIKHFQDTKFGNGLQLKPITNDLQMDNGRMGGGGHYVVNI